MYVLIKTTNQRSFLVLFVMNYPVILVPRLKTWLEMDVVYQDLEEQQEFYWLLILIYWNKEIPL